MMRVVVAVLLLLVQQAHAQPAAGDPLTQPSPSPPQPSPPPSPPQVIACDECVKGDAELAALGPAIENPLRAYADRMIAEWVPLRIEGDVLSPPQEASLREHLDERVDLHEAIRALRRHSDEQLIAISYALCRSPDADCARYLAAGLRRVRDIEPGYIPGPNHQPYGLPPGEPGCDPYVRSVKSPKLGFGVEYGSGWQRSARPVDGRAWSFGLEARARVRKTFGVVARVDRSTGSDEGIDADGDGRDDAETGRVLRWTGLVGPSLLLSTHRDREAPRYWQVDGLLGLARSGDQSGVVGALDISYQLVVARLGVRVMQGFGDARDESGVLVHTGLQFGAGPQYSYGAGCGQHSRPSGSAWAVALDLPLLGYTPGVGVITPGLGVEGALHASARVDAIVRGDVLWMPSGDNDRALHSTLLAGARFDLSRKGGMTRTGIFTTLAAGYAHVATVSSAAIQSGPVVEGSIGWGAQGSDGAAYLRLHGRFGVTEDNRDLRAVFLSFGAELRLDRTRWRDRN